MSDFNPYAAPATSLATADEPLPDVAGEEPEVWRSGRYLVFRRGARLPDRCVKSNEPATQRLSRQIMWYPPLLILTILVNLLIFLILVLCLRKQARVEIPLNDYWFQRRRRSIAIGWGGSLFCVALIFLSPVISDPPVWILPGLLGLLGFMCFGYFRGRLFIPHRITDDYVWLRGVNRRYLAGLPEFPLR